MSSPLLSIRGLSKAFGALRAVDDVSFDVAPLCVTTVIGPNGAGKSTLFNLLSGALRPSSGQVHLNGREITGMSPAAIKAFGLSRSFQITNLFFDLTVAENIRLAAQYLEPAGQFFLPLRTSARSSAKAAELLRTFSLENKAHELAGNLSHGEQRRLEIAVCLASEPKLLLLDEPTQGMSHADTEDAKHLISSLAKTVTILLIEHDVRLVMDISDVVVVMHQGRKLAVGRPEDVRADPAVQAAYFGPV